MSHWKTGKMKLKCSLAVLKRALINIMPQWEQHIKIDTEGNLPIHSSYQGTSAKKFHLVVPKGSNTGVSGSDLGFERASDGSWAITRDYLPRGFSDPEGQVLQQVATMKARAIAAVRGYQITKDQQVGDEQVIEMIIPAGEEQQFIKA
jgi:hypothetical protein